MTGLVNAIRLNMFREVPKSKNKMQKTKNRTQPKIFHWMEKIFSTCHSITKQSPGIQKYENLGSFNSALSAHFKREVGHFPEQEFVPA